MNETTTLYDIFRVGERFQRSVNIAADYGNRQALDDYILTYLGRAVLSRIGHSLRANATGRAWSITGPYGAGKSAAILFLAEVLGYPVNSYARTLLKSTDPELLEELYDQLPGLQSGGFVIVPLAGSREPMAWTLLDGLISSLSVLETSTTALDEQLCAVRNLYNQARSARAVSTASVAEAIQLSARIVQSANPSILGLLIIYDELGKALEYATLHPEHGDIGILQTLAELAARSEEAPVGLITILHQAFEHYAAGLSPVQQREWAKVQGRFEDIGFLESPGELLSLINKAIYPVKPLDHELSEVIASEAIRAERLSILPRDLDRQVTQHVLAGCAPLHPTVALALGRLFRSRLSQNERSLFAFLSSGEPYGFQEYLRQETWSGDSYRPFYRLDNLYDYVLAAMGSVLYIQAQGKKWAEIEDALNRLPKEAGELEARLIKTIGLLGLLGDQHYLKASEDVLAYALADGSSSDADSVHRALECLADWGITVYRRFKDAYSLWQGSDIDLNERFEQGLAQIDRSKSLASLLQTRDQVKPYVAKRHLHETGTFRYFIPWIIDFENFQKIARRPFGVADGAVVFILGTNSTPIEEIVRSVQAFSAKLESPRRDLIFFAIPRGVQGIRETFEETLAWEWVADNTPELEGDSIARRELAARHLAAQERLERASAHCFEKAHSFRACVWVYAGSELHFESARALSVAVSDACDRVYKDAPTVQNELINRRKLSSAAAAARRNLLEQMLTHPTRAKLGMEGYPPEMSIYLSVLERSGLHHQAGDAWAFGPPEGEDFSRVTPLWQAIDTFLTTTEEAQRPVNDLYDLLRQPPYGIKEGLLPIYLAVAMLHWEAEVALYENGSFIPNIGIAVFERLIKVPEQFRVQRYRLGGARSYLFERYSALLGRGQTSHDQVTLLTAVRPILGFVRQLPSYTHLTRSLSPEATAVRDAVLSAREPYRLLFEDLPAAVRIDARQVNTDLETAQLFFTALRNALLELQRAYDILLTTIQGPFLEAMRLPQAMTAARQEVTRRALILQEYVADLRLRAFVLRLADTRLSDQEWIESIASCLANKPPKHWNDQDLLRYGTELAEIAGRFRRVEEIAVEAQKIGKHTEGASLIRLGVMVQSGEEQRDIVTILPEEEAEVHAVANELDAALRHMGASTRISLAAIAELTRQVLASSSQKERDNK